MDTNITGWFTTEDGVHIPIRGTQTKKQALDSFVSKKSSSVSNPKQNFYNKLQEQTGVDISEVVETRFGMDKKRNYISVHLEDLGRVNEQRVRQHLAKRGVRIEEGGGFGDTIYYREY